MRALIDTCVIIDALQNRLNSKNPDAPWQDFVSDVIFLNPAFTDAEGNKVIPENGVQRIKRLDSVGLSQAWSRPR